MKKTNKWMALATTSLGTFMSALNSSIVNIANPVLAADFGVSMVQIQWVVTIYLIATSSMMLLFSRLGDRIGSHKIYSLGVATITVGSLCCALSGNLPVLLVSRILQGLGAAMTMAVNMALVATIFPLEQRGRALGIVVLLVGMGHITGPAAGGFILAYASWHFVFLISVPFGLLTFILSVVWLRSPSPKRPEISLDIGGSIVFAVAITSLIIFLSGGFAGQEWFGLVLLVSLVVFIFVERRAKSPLIEPKLFMNKRFTFGNLIAFFSYSANMMLVFQIPFFLDEVWSIPVGAVGLLMMVSPILMAIGAPVSGFLSDHFGALKIMSLALLAGIICYVLALLLGLEVSIWLFVGIMAFSGIGSGVLNAPNSSEIITAAGRKHATFASGFIGTSRNIAFCIGAALSASIFSTVEGFLISSPELFNRVAGEIVLDHLIAFKAVLLVCLIFQLISLGICLYLRYGRNDVQSETHKDLKTTEG